MDDARIHYGIIKGRLVLVTTQQPAPDVQVVLPALKQLVFTDAEGIFTFSRVPFGSHQLNIGGQGTDAQTISVYLHDAVADVGAVLVARNDSSVPPFDAAIPSIALEENEASDEEDGAPHFALNSLNASSHEPFIQAISYAFSPYGFHARGYARPMQEVQANGFSLNDANDGDAGWARLGGLYDVLKSKEQTYGLAASGYAFGSLNGSAYFDASAASLSPQTRITYSLTDRNFQHRILFNKSSGMMRGGWAYNFSFSRRWAKEGYFPGTFYDGWAYAATLSKQFGNGRHLLHLITFGAPTSHGLSAPVTEESVTLSGNRFYNPDWGFQNGAVRNARVRSNFLPTSLLVYEFHPNNRLRWASTLGCEFGKEKTSGLDWFNAADPRPDYYRYLPSYFSLNGQNPADAPFYQHPQIEWDALINANRLSYDSIKDANGIAGNIVRGHRSAYVLSDDVQDLRKWCFNSNLERVLNTHVNLAAGFQLVAERNEFYRALTDLLGGDFFVNLNQYANQENAPPDTYNQYDFKRAQPRGADGRKIQVRLSLSFYAKPALGTAFRRFQPVGFLPRSTWRYDWLFARRAL